MSGIMNQWKNRGKFLDKNFTPFRLLAIVNRLDLRGNSGYGFSNAGEGRFVFGLLNNDCNPLPFTVIFEFGINKRQCQDIVNFGKEWKDLSTMPFGSAYLTALQKITDQFSQCGTNTAKPNQSSLNQLRTDEITLDKPWELREFNLTGSGLEPVTTKKEPDNDHNNTQLLADFINANQVAIETNNYDVPLQFSKKNFLGSHALAPKFWDGPPGSVSSDLARHVLSLNTCSGCHTSETQTSFTHVSPAGRGQEAGLSGFLVGPDPVNNPTASLIVPDAANRPAGATHPFNDLHRRALDLNTLLSTKCGKGGFSNVFEVASVLTFRPINMTH
jgi:hypothetical protein